MGIYIYISGCITNHAGNITGSYNWVLSHQAASGSSLSLWISCHKTSDVCAGWEAEPHFPKTKLI